MDVKFSSIPQIYSRITRDAVGVEFLFPFPSHFHRDSHLNSHMDTHTTDTRPAGPLRQLGIFGTTFFLNCYNSLFVCVEIANGLPMLRLKWPSNLGCPLFRIFDIPL